MKAGTCIHSTTLLANTFFEQTQLFITEYNEKGAMGFIVNRLFPRSLNELEEFTTSTAFPLYEGGPVDTTHLYFIHRRPDLISGGTWIAGNTYLGGDFRTAVMHINRNTITTHDIKLLIGYCGWDYQELDSEIAEGSWAVMPEAEPFTVA